MISFELWGPTCPELNLFQDFSIKGAGKFASLFRCLPCPLVIYKWKPPETSLEVQWSGPRASTAGSMSSIPAQGSKTLNNARHQPNRKQMKNSWLPVSQLVFISITKIWLLSPKYPLSDLHASAHNPVQILTASNLQTLEIRLSLYFLPSCEASQKLPSNPHKAQIWWRHSVGCSTAFTDSPLPPELKNLQTSPLPTHPFLSHWTLHFWPFRSPTVWRSFPHTKEFSTTLAGSYNALQFWHHLAGNSARFHRARSWSHKTTVGPFQMSAGSRSSSGYPQLLSNLPINWRFPWPSPWVQLICWSGSQNSGVHLLMSVVVVFSH